MPVPPILVLNRADEQNPFSSYLEEVLQIEGYLSYKLHDLEITTLREANIQQYLLVIVPRISLSAADRDSLTKYVRNGGRLIAFRPPQNMASVFGLRKAAAESQTAPNEFVVFEGSHEVVRDISAGALQCHGEVDAYEVDTAEVIAWLGADLGESSPYPAIVCNRFDGGQVAAFTYDFLHTIVTCHQGNPENASTGKNPDADGDGMFRPGDFFEGVLDPRLRLVPQGDVHQDVLVRLIRLLMGSVFPLPRVWHFSKGRLCIALLSGDSDGMEAGDLDQVLELTRQHDARFTFYVTDEHIGMVSREKFQELYRDDYDFGPHPYCGPKPQVMKMSECIDESVSKFHEQYGQRPVSSRNHSIIFPGWIETGRSLAKNGIRFCMDYAAMGQIQYGYLNGSGLPARLISEEGKIADIYVQCTQLMDNAMYTASELLRPMSREGVVEACKEMIQDCQERYHGVFNACFHPQHARGEQSMPQPLVEVLCYLKERDIPTLNARDWAEFNDSRRSVTISDLKRCGEGEYGFCVSGGRFVSDLTIMLPPVHDGAQFCALLLGDKEYPCEQLRMEALDWVAFQVDIEPSKPFQFVACYSKS